MLHTGTNLHRLNKALCCIALSLVFCASAAAQPQELLQPQGLNHAGIYALRQLVPELTGSGVRFAVVCRSITYINGEPQNDYRPYVGHNCFKAGQFGFKDRSMLSPGVSPHATAICSILFGEEPDALNPDLGQFHYQGAVPHAQADIYEFWHFLINNVFPHTPPDADVITAGIGGQFEDWWTRGIEALVEHHGLVVVAGIGNGSDAYDPPLYPGASANVIGVGVINSVNTDDLAASLANFALAYPQHSSTGPTADGRCKPDIVAPGNCLAADANDAARYEPTGNWSSFSTPVVAGATGLLIQKAKQDPQLALAVSPQGGNCVIKAILLNSATRLPFWHKGRLTMDDDHSAPLDYIQGAGMLNAVGAYNQLIAGSKQPGPVSAAGWDNNVLDTTAGSAENVYRITVDDPNTRSVTVTLVWNRHYADTYPFRSMPLKDADLRLEIWAVDPEDDSNSYLLDYSDSSDDNVEHIFCRIDPNYTDYELVVACGEGSQRRVEVTERYALAWNVADSRAADSIYWHDLNGDGVVDNTDFALLVNNWITAIESPQSYVFGDIDTNGAIDVNDLKILLDNSDRRADWAAPIKSEDDI